MAGVVLREFDYDSEMHHAVARERVFRDRFNPLDAYNDIELYERFRMRRGSILTLLDELRDVIWHPHI